MVTLNHIEQAVVNTSFYISSQTSSQVITVNDILSDVSTHIHTHKFEILYLRQVLLLSEVFFWRVQEKALNCGLFLLQEDTEVNFVIKVHDCPPGYVLSQSPTARYSTCECGYNDVSIIECDGSAIYLKVYYFPVHTCLIFKTLSQDGLWAVAVNGAGGYDLMTRYCPAGYCKCTLKNGVCKYIFDSTAPDEQCTCARKGLTCPYA